MKTRIKKFMLSAIKKSLAVENITIIITIVFSMYLVLNSKFSDMSIADLVRWTILLLGLLSTSIFIERLGMLTRIENVTEATHNHLISQGLNPSVDHVFSDRKSLPPLEERLEHAKEIMITGGSLFRLGSEYTGYFEQKAKDGCKLKFLLLHPESDAARLVAKYVVYELNNYTAYKSQIDTSLYNFQRLKQHYNTLVEIRTYKLVPPYSLLITDPERSNGSVLVELYTCAVPTRDRPQFTLFASKDPQYYKFFLNQFRLMWDEAEPYNITSI